MKIGIDIRTLMDLHYSGIPEYTLNLIKEILRLDKINQYKLFYNSFHDIKWRLPEFKDDNVELVSCHYPNKILNYLYFKILQYPKIDQLLGVDLFFMPHLNFIALSDSCQCVLTIHDLSFLRYSKFFSLRKNFWHQMINVKSLVKKFDQLVAVSENTKRDIVELCGVSPDKIKVIYSAVGEQIKDLKDDNSKLAEIKRKYQLPDKFILHLGTIEPRKNIASLIYAYELLQKKSVQLANYELIIVGVNGWKSKEIFKVWQKSNFKNKIKFIGYVDSINKIYLYRLASVFVYPSFYEGFGFPPLEAMTLGVPVITSFNSSLPEVTAGAALMIDPENISQIAKCLEEVLTDQELREDLIKKGLERARQFSWEKAAMEYLEVFRSV